MLAYELRQVAPPEGVDGHLVRVTAADVPFLTPWVRTFYQESLHDEVTDEVAAQMMINTLTALTVIRAAHDSLRGARSHCLRRSLAKRRSRRMRAVQTSPSRSIVVQERA